MRFLYSLLLYLLLPFIFLRLLWRSRRLPDYRKRVKERFGFYPFRLEGCIWVHAVSVGETIAAIPLIKHIQSHYPDQALLITTMTPTGAARVRAVFGDSVKHCYLPYDFPGAVRRFLNTMKPVVGIIMETELWPNLLTACRNKNVPVALLNARLSAKSAKGYGYIPKVTHQMLNGLNFVAANSKGDAERFIKLGMPASKVHVTGNIKFDLQLPLDISSKSTVLHAMLGRHRYIWIAASTHQGEEELMLAAHKQLKEKNPEALLILVPRHPDRFDAVAKLCQQQGFAIARRSKHESCEPSTDIYLADTMGELLLMYAVSDVTFVGGSLIQNGGHNILEPAALGKPILTGPHLFNFAEISQLFLDADALFVVDDVPSLVKRLVELQDPHLRHQLGMHALQVMVRNRGALERQSELIDKMIDNAK